MDELKEYYNEHASQARQHEDQRERMTNIILSIAGVLIGLITFSELSIWSVPASISVIIIGFYGFLFAGKHYERFKFHTSIMKAIRDEIDRIALDKNAVQSTLQSLREKGESNHYKKFTWPRFSGTDSELQAGAKSWIARQRVHTFWELIHILVLIIGIGLTTAIIIKTMTHSPKEPIKVQLVK